MMSLCPFNYSTCHGVSATTSFTVLHKQSICTQTHHSFQWAPKASFCLNYFRDSIFHIIALETTVKNIVMDLNQFVAP